MCVVYVLYRKMELRYWLVPGNVKNNSKHLMTSPEGNSEFCFSRETKFTLP